MTITRLFKSKTPDHKTEAIINQIDQELKFGYDDYVSDLTYSHPPPPDEAVEKIIRNGFSLARNRAEHKPDSLTVTEWIDKNIRDAHTDYATSAAAFTSYSTPSEQEYKEIMENIIRQFEKRGISEQKMITTLSTLIKETLKNNEDDDLTKAAENFEKLLKDTLFPKAKVIPIKSNLHISNDSDLSL